MASACVLVALACVVLDAWAAPLPGAGEGTLWLHVAAAIALACAVRFMRGFRDPREWSTPLDGLVLASLAIAAAGLVPVHGAGPPARWFWQVVACSALYLGLVPLLRREPRAVRTIWNAFTVACAGLGAHAVWSSTSGLSGLAQQSALADARWAGSHVLAKTLAFATVVTVGGALERGAGPLSRLAVLLGATGVVLHAVSGGFGLGPSALARLDDPIYFSTASVTFMLAVGVARLAWSLLRARPHEAARWRSLAAAMGGVGAASLLGESTGGEALRVLAALAGAAVVAELTGVRASHAGLPGAEEPATVTERAA